MEKYLMILERTKLFDQIKPEELKEMLHCLEAQRRSFQKEELVFRRGECISEIALLLEGNVHIRQEDYWGNLSILSEVAPGELFGEVYACLGNAQILNDAVAVRESTVLFINVHKILTLCPSVCRFHERLIQNLLTVLAEKNRLLTRKIAHMSQRTTKEKILSYLSEQSLKAGSASFDIPFDRQQLADYLSVDRSAMSRELSKMREEGILKFERNHFVLKSKTPQ